MIELRNITLSFGERVLLDSVNATFGKGSLTALIGRNGAGKSTLLRAISAMGQPNAGSILLGGEDIAQMTAERAARTVGVVTTERIRIPNLTVEQTVALGRAPYTNWIGHLQAADRQIVSQAIREVGMEEFAHKSMDSLSDGESQRVMIARVLAQQTPIILLDEPTAFLDIPTRHQTCRLLQQLALREQKCILFSTHDLDSALPYCNRVAVVDPPQLLSFDSGEPSLRDNIERIFGIR